MPQVTHMLARQPRPAEVQKAPALPPIGCPAQHAWFRPPHAPQAPAMLFAPHAPFWADWQGAMAEMQVPPSQQPLLPQLLVSQQA